VTRPMETWLKSSGGFDVSMDGMDANPPHISTAAENAGSHVSRIIKLTVSSADIRHAPMELAVRERHFAPGRAPIRTMVQLANLGLPELLLEVDAIAVAGRP
jgi:2-iminobutanoate/2-iminopropanoate deaminase